MPARALNLARLVVALSDALPPPPPPVSPSSGSGPDWRGNGPYTDRGFWREPFDEGNTAALVHGANSARTIAPLADAWEGQLLEEAPHLARPTFARARRLLAEVLAERTIRLADLDARGLLDDRGRDKPGADRLDRTTSRVRRLLAECALTPASFGKLLSEAVAAAREGRGDVGAAR